MIYYLNYLNFSQIETYWKSFKIANNTHTHTISDAIRKKIPLKANKPTFRDTTLYHYLLDNLQKLTTQKHFYLFIHPQARLPPKF